MNWYPCLLFHVLDKNESSLWLASRPAYTSARTRLLWLSKLTNVTFFVCTKHSCAAAVSSTTLMLIQVLKLIVNVTLCFPWLLLPSIFPVIITVYSSSASSLIFILSLLLCSYCLYQHFMHANDSSVKQHFCILVEIVQHSLSYTRIGYFLKLTLVRISDVRKACIYSWLLTVQLA